MTIDKLPLMKKAYQQKHGCEKISHNPTVTTIIKQPKIYCADNIWAHGALSEALPVLSWTSHLVRFKVSIMGRRGSHCFNKKLGFIVNIFNYFWLKYYFHCMLPSSYSTTPLLNPGQHWSRIDSIGGVFHHSTAKIWEGRQQGRPRYLHPTSIHPSYLFSSGSLLHAISYCSLLLYYTFAQSQAALINHIFNWRSISSLYCKDLRGAVAGEADVRASHYNQHVCHILVV